MAKAPKTGLHAVLSGGGVGSRKLWLSVFCLALLLLGVAIAAWKPGTGSLYSEFTTGVLGVLSIYCGANVVGRWGVAKHVGSAMATQGEPEGTKTVTVSEDGVSEETVKPKWTPPKPIKKPV